MAGRKIAKPDEGATVPVPIPDATGATAVAADDTAAATPDPAPPARRAAAIRDMVAGGLKSLAVVRQVPAGEAGADEQVVVRFELPVFGALSVIFGITSLFNSAYMFSPLAIVFAVLALVRGNASFGLVGLICALAGILTSPFLWSLFGLAWLWSLIT